VRDNSSFVPSWLGLGELYLRTNRTGDVQGVMAQLSRFAPDVSHQLGQRLGQHLNQRLNQPAETKK
jgi:hypothetical protein